MHDSNVKNIGLLIEYEEILLHKRKDFSSAYMGKGTLAKSACSVFRFAFEDILGWSPQMVRDYISPELMELLHLQKPLNRISFPPELDKKNDLFYLAWMMYPETINIKKRELVLRVYEKVRNKIISKFPKGFFSEAEGELNACICLQYVINQELKFNSIQELYEMFADTETISIFLRKNKLYAPCCEFYETPLDMLHNALPESEKNELFYQFSRFREELKIAKGEPDSNDLQC